MYGLAVLSFAVLVGQAAATAVVGAAPLASLTKRQTTLDPSDIPSQCNNQCSPAVNYLNTCGESVTCLCSASTNTAFYNCLECVVEALPTASLMPTLQATLTEYENNCAAAGAKVSFLSLTLPNGSSGAPTATGAKPVTAPATTSNPSANSNPLARNGAGIVGVSVASVASAAGVAIAALFF